jgi:HK97 gp10 family phage protein
VSSIIRSNSSAISAAASVAMGDLVRKAAMDVVAHAQQAAPVDTGNLRNSIRQHPTGPWSARVVVGAEYGAYIEYGHRLVAWGHDTGRDVPARPFLTPAVERVRPEFHEAAKHALEHL